MQKKIIVTEITVDNGSIINKKQSHRINTLHKSGLLKSIDEHTALIFKIILCCLKTELIFVTTKI